jgi:hypothetical protein
MFSLTMTSDLPDRPSAQYPLFGQTSWRVPHFFITGNLLKSLVGSPLACHATELALAK